MDDNIEKYNEEMLLGLTYLEGILCDNKELSDSVAENISPTELFRAMVCAAGVAIVALSGELGTEDVDTIKSLRNMSL